MEKARIRAMVKKLRKEMPESVLSEKSRAICQRVMLLDEFSAAATVLAYMDCKGEVSTKPLIEEAWRLGKKVAVPRVEGDDMHYYYIDSFADVADGYFHVPEPLAGQKQCQTEAEDALLIVPGVGFDPDRNRCGYGKGFYDRYLAAHAHHFTVALAFDFQIVDEVPARPEDIRPRMLITETRIWAGEHDV